MPFKETNFQYCHNYEESFRLHKSELATVKLIEFWKAKNIANQDMLRNKSNFGTKNNHSF